MFLKMFTIVAFTLLLTVAAHAQISAGISINDGDLSSFYLAIGQTYSVPEREVIIIHERQIPDEEIPVVFFIANRAHVRPESIVELRLAGQSWMAITMFYHLDPSIYYIELDGDPGPEYGRAYGHWKRPRREWSQIRFEDDDVVKMVNLRFVSKRYGVRPSEVVRLRKEHGSFTKVVHTVDSPDYKARRINVDKPVVRKQEPDTRIRTGGKSDGDGKAKVRDDDDKKKGKGKKNH